MTMHVTETGQVLNHHLQAMGAGDLDEIVKDYVDDSVLVMPDVTIKGRDAIRAAFEGFLSDLLKPGTYEFALDTRRLKGDVAYIIWHAKCASADIVLATDTFIVKDGKIAVQTFAAKIAPR